MNQSYDTICLRTIREDKYILRGPGESSSFRVKKIQKLKLFGKKMTESESFSTDWDKYIEG
jgi:hypothetical protein